MFNFRPDSYEVQVLIFRTERFTVFVHETTFDVMVSDAGDIYSYYLDDEAIEMLSTLYIEEDPFERVVLVAEYVATREPCNIVLAICQDFEA